MLLLDALNGINEQRAPVWLMRQAGRYMPAYQELRKKYSLKELFFTPELAAQVTLLPIDLLSVDAAILFSDITVIALALGLELDFQEGPTITPFVTPRTVAHLTAVPVEECLGAIEQTIRLLLPRLKVPLIGFCGGPFTVASYLIEKHTGQDLPQTKKWMMRDPQTFHLLLDRICTASIAYLQMQEKAGVQAIQIFDSWAHVLSQEDFQTFCLPYLKRMIQALQTPVIFFMRGACAQIDTLVQLGCSALSLDWQRPLSQMRQSVPSSIALQGNLDPDILYAPLPTIRTKVEELIHSMEGDKAWILNLGHGIKPDMPFEAVQCLVDTACKILVS